MLRRRLHVFFFFNDTATTEIYTLSLHDALPILYEVPSRKDVERVVITAEAVLENVNPTLVPRDAARRTPRDRKSTRLNSSHANISYAVFCLKKKNTHEVLRSY